MLAPGGGGGGVAERCLDRDAGAVMTYDSAEDAAHP